MIFPFQRTFATVKHISQEARVHLGVQLGKGYSFFYVLLLLLLLLLLFLYLCFCRRLHDLVISPALSLLSREFQTFTNGLIMKLYISFHGYVYILYWRNYRSMQLTRPIFSRQNVELLCISHLCLGIANIYFFFRK